MTFRHTSRRKLVIGAMVAALLFLAILGALALRDAVSLRSQAAEAIKALSRVEHDPNVLTTHEGRISVERDLDTARRIAEQSAMAIDQSFSLSVIGAIPYLGRATHGAKELATDAATTATLLSGIVNDADAVVRQSSDHRIDWEKLPQLIADATSTSTSLRQLLDHGKGLWGPVGAKRSTFTTAVRSLANRLDDVAAGGKLGASLLGANHPSRVLVLAANNAEMRAQGAFLSYALLDFHHGSITHVTTGSLSELERSIALASSPPTAQMFVNNGATRLWSAINMTANFSWTGHVAAEKLHATLGFRPDFVVGVDVVTLQELLGAVGSVKVSSLREPLTKSNVATVLLKSLYERFTPDQRTKRLEVLSQVIAAAIGKAVEPTTNPVSVTRSFARAIGGRHLLLWSTDPAAQAAIRELNASGELDQHHRDVTFSVAVEAAVAAKMDAFDVHCSTSYKVVVAPDRSAMVDLAVTIANDAPRNLRPGSYIYGPDGWNAHQPGEYLANVFVWTPLGSAQQGAPIDGGLELRATSVDLLPGKSAVVHFYSHLKASVDGRVRLRLVPQPRLFPTQTNVTVVDGNQSKTWSFPLASTQELLLRGKR